MNFSSSLIRSLRSLSSSISFKRTFCIIHHPSEGDYDFNDFLESDTEYDELRRSYIADGRKAHSIFVSQPYIKFPGGFVESKSSPELRLQEAISLVHSIPHWKTSDAGLFALSDYQQPLLFSDKIIERLEGRIKGSMTNGLFIAVNQLLGKQQFSLERLLGIPVFDRFSIILEIFKHYAISAEAKLQLGLAEIQYLRSRVNQYVPEFHGSRYSMGKTSKGGGMTPKQRYQKLLEDRAKTLRKALSRMEKNKELVQTRRKTMQIPSVSVIGYTNCGKTSLIKALSRDGNLSPEDRLFATLQTTAHCVKLPTIRKVLFLDSVGFISDIPKELMESFNATFKDVKCCDLIVHVYDVAHPDLKNHKDTVVQTLKFLQFPENLVSSVINVANKIDLIGSDSVETNRSIDDHDIPISAVTGQNINRLIEKVDSKLVQITGQKVIKIKVPNGGEELRWLHKESSIQSIEPDPDPNFLIIRTLMNEGQKKRFLAYFGRTR